MRSPRVALAWVCATLLTTFTPAVAQQPPPRRADEGPVTVELRSGETLRGRLLGFERGVFRLAIGAEVREVREADVRRLEFTAPTFQAVHGAPTGLTAEPAGPNRVVLRWTPSESEYVLTTFEVFMQAGEGAPWESVAVHIDPSRAERELPAPDGVPLRFKLVSRAEPDADHPRVRSGEVSPLPPDQRVHETPPTAPVIVEPRLVVEADGPGTVRVIARGAPLREVLPAIAELGDLDLTVAASVLDDRVSATIHDVWVVDALRLVSESAGGAGVVYDQDQAHVLVAPRASLQQRVELEAYVLGPADPDAQRAHLARAVSVRDLLGASTIPGAKSVFLPARAALLAQTWAGGHEQVRAALGGRAPAAAAAPRVAPAGVTLAFEGDVRAAIAEIAARAGAPLLIGGHVEGTVLLRHRDLGWPQALRYALRAAGPFELIETPAAYVALPAGKAEAALRLERWELTIPPVELWGQGGVALANPPDDAGWPRHPLAELERLVASAGAPGSAVALDPDGHALLVQLPAPLGQDLRAALAAAGYVAPARPLLAAGAPLATLPAAGARVALGALAQERRVNLLIDGPYDLQVSGTFAADAPYGAVARAVALATGSFAVLEEPTGTFRLTDRATAEARLGTVRVGLSTRSGPSAARLAEIARRLIARRNVPGVALSYDPTADALTLAAPTADLPGYVALLQAADRVDGLKALQGELLISLRESHFGAEQERQLEVALQLVGPQGPGPAVRYRPSEEAEAPLRVDGLRGRVGFAPGTRAETIDRAGGVLELRVGPEGGEPEVRRVLVPPELP